MQNLKTMELKIEKGTLIKDIQKQFNAAYPYLKIEFFKQQAFAGEKSISATDRTNPPMPVSKIERFSKSASINIEGKRTTAQLEQDFREISGISIKLYRKSGSLWIETTLTDSWSLEKQNEEGEFMSAPIVHKNLFDTDKGDEWMDKD